VANAFIKLMKIVTPLSQNVVYNVNVRELTQAAITWLAGFVHYYCVCMYSIDFVYSHCLKFTNLGVYMWNIHTDFDDHSI
jgi:hypothetical protein